jgi:hypothetical protein
MKVHLATYGDEKYKYLKDKFIRSAEDSKFFDEIHSFSHLDIDPVFYKNVYEPLMNERGGGYWIWKPYVVKSVLDQLKEGEVLFYCDAGSHINRNGRNRFFDYLQMVSYSNTGSIDFGLSWREYQFTKQEVFDFFGSPLKIVQSGQLVGGILIFRKCAHSMMLVDKWYDLALHNSFLFTDEKIKPQHPGFIDHRHDQSIFSVIRKTYGANIIRNETFFHDYERDGQKFPIWATQLKA